MAESWLKNKHLHVSFYEMPMRDQRLSRCFVTRELPFQTPIFCLQVAVRINLNLGRPPGRLIGLQGTGCSVQTWVATG